MTKKTQLVRGPRIENLLETTYSKLRQNTLKFKPTSEKRQWAVDPIQIKTIGYKAHPENNALTISATVDSNSSSYSTEVLFTDCDYEDTKGNATVTFTAANGNEYHVKSISLATSNVKVSCTCMDFRWRFAMYNNKDKSLLGNPPKNYTNKTKRKPGNPGKVPGVCKHIMKLVIAAKQTKLVK